MKKFTKIDGKDVYLDLKAVTAVSDYVGGRQVTVQEDGKDISKTVQDVIGVEIRCGLGHYYVTGVTALEVADMSDQAKRG